MTGAIVSIGAALLLAAAPAGPTPLSHAVEALHAAGFSGQVVAADADHVTFDETVGLKAPPRRWIWGSVSKQVTAALVMIAVDDGKVSLDDRVGARLPEFADPAGRRAMIRQLLQHTSGLANPDAGAAETATPPFYLRRGRDVGGTADAIGACAGPPAGEPGRFSYNNCDTIVIGAILERATGRSFSSLLRDRITAPLGMTTTRLARSGERLALGASQKSAEPVNVATFGPAGALIGSAGDLVRFDQALIKGTLLSAKSRDAMWQGNPSLGYVALGAWSFAAPLKGCIGVVRLVERRGSVDGVQSRNILAPDRKRALIVFTPDADFDFGEIWQGKGPSYDLASAAFCDG